MKFVVLIAMGLLIGGLSFLQMQNTQLNQDLELAMGFQSQLQQQAEENVRQRLEFEKQIQGLQEQILSASIRLSNLSTSLQEARERSNPEYDRLLEQARQEVAQESAPIRRRQGGGPFSPFADPATADARAADSIPKLYEDYVNNLGIAGTERLDVMDALVEYGSERYQMLGDLLEGNLSTDQAASMFGADALIDSMADMLTEQQLADLRDYDLGIRQDTVREVYGQDLGRSGSAISGADQDRVMDVMLEELFSAESNYGAIVAGDGSAVTAFNDQLEAYQRTRDRLQDELNAEQLTQLDQFVAGQSTGMDVLLEATTDGSGRTALTRARVSVDDLP